MKIKLKNLKNPIKRWETYGGFGSKISTALNSGEAIEVDNIPDISKDLVEVFTKEVKSKTKSKEASKDDSKKENK